MLYNLVSQKYNIISCYSYVSLSYRIRYNISRIRNRILELQWNILWNIKFNIILYYANIYFKIPVKIYKTIKV